MYTPNIQKPSILSVSQLNYYLKSVIENDPRLNFVLLSGEISNLIDHYRSGHIYLSLKDERSVIRAVMFAGNARRLKFRPQDGMKVLCRGRVSVYEPSGQYQLYIEDMQPDGVGALSLAYEQLKRELEKQGLFDNAHKKPLPRFPRTVGVITSPTGAAVQDIRNILYRRFPGIEIKLCPVLVQGEGAPPQLISAVQKLDSEGECDVIIIGRGGGSIEDLWAFNSKELAFAVYNCRTPIISAVGHETDFTICDFVADMRAPTPSAAAELAVPDVRELKANYLSQRQYIQSLIEARLRGQNDKLRLYLHAVQSAPSVKNIDKLFDKYSLYQRQLVSLADNKISLEELKLKKTAAKLESLNPLSVLSRGYALAEQNGRIIKSAAALDREEEFTLTFSDGKVNARVTGE